MHFEVTPLPRTDAFTVTDEHGLGYGHFPRRELAVQTCALLNGHATALPPPEPPDPLLKKHYERYIKPNESLYAENHAR